MKKWAIRIAVTIFVSVIFSYVTYLTLFHYIRIKLEHVLASRLQASVKIQDFDFSWDEGSLFVKAINVQNIFGQPNIRMTIDQVDVYIDPGGLRKKPVHIQAMAFRNPRLFISLPTFTREAAFCVKWVKLIK